MDRKILKLIPGIVGVMTWAGFTVLPARAGTRLIPPPPPRYLESDAQVPTSYWGEQPANPYRTNEEEETPSRRRFGSLEDEEGREIDFNAGVRRNRRPAGLEVKGHSTESAPKKDQKPVLSVKPVSNSEKGPQSDLTESVVADLADPIERRKGVQEVAVIAGDLGFFPKTIFVSRDVPVRLFVTGASKQNLCLMMDTFNVRKQVRASKIEEITFMPTQPGTYRFYCPINNGEGTLVVKELTTAPEPMEN